MDYQRLGSEESFDRSTAAGHFETALQALVYDGLAGCDCDDADIEQGSYRIHFGDGTTAQVQFDFTAQNGVDVHAVPCEWVRWRGELAAAGRILDRGAGTWREAVTWLQKAAHIDGRS